MLGAVGMDMSGGIGGDIWSTNAFSFESPLKDILDSGNYTVEDLLQEDELLQELRGCHDVLITYLSSEASVTKLLQYVIQPPPPSSTLSSTSTSVSIAPPSTAMNENTKNDILDTNPKKPGEWLLRHLQNVQQSIPSMHDDLPSSSSSPPPPSSSSSSLLLLRQIRFPYMACEVICCEIPSIINTLVDGKCIFPHLTNTNPNNNSITGTANGTAIGTGTGTDGIDHTHKNDNDTTGSPATQRVVQLSPNERGTEEHVVVIVVDTPNQDEEDEDNIISHPTMTTTITDYTEIITSDSQGDMVEVMAQTKTTIVNESSNLEEGGDALLSESLSSSPPPTLSLLDLLFSLLYQTPVGELDDYRAGYFDKILSVLFRKRPEELTTYINSGGIYGRHTLIQCMFRHLYSHSIMQIAQRLLLPQRPIGQPQTLPTSQQQSPSMNEEEGGEDILVATENGSLIQQQPQPLNGTENGAEIVAGDEGDDDPEAVGVRCDWGNNPEVLDMLLDTLIGPQPRTTMSSSSDMEDSQVLDLSLNASEVLITIIQNSMLSSTTMLTLTSNDVIARIVDAATILPNPDYFSPHESILTSAMNVLESLVLQLGGYGAVGTMTLLPEDEMNPSSQMDGCNDMNNNNNDDAIFEEDPPHTVTDQIQEVDSDDTLNTGQEVGLVNDKHLISDLGAMLEHLPRLLDRLSLLLRHPSTSKWTSPTQFSNSQPVQLLGNSRLRIVRVLESLVLLGDPDVDSILVQSSCLEICLDFFWEFQWCSMLHQSVANLLVHVFEGQNTRFEMQKYFLVKCNLLGRLMDSFTDDKTCHGMGNTTNLHTQTTLRTPEVNAMSTVASETGSSMITGDRMETEINGKAISVALPIDQESKTEASPSVGDRVESKELSSLGETHLSPPAQALRCGYMGHVIIICQALVHAYTSNPHDHLMNEDADGLGSDQMGNMNDISYEETEHDASTVLPKKVKVNSDAVEGTPGVGSEDTDDEEATGPKDIYGDPLLLFEIVHTHQLAEKWHDFVDTTLSAETAIQSTPLGGLSMQSTGLDMLLSHRPGLADEGYMMGDDGEGPPVPPRGMLGGGDMIHMDENDLDIAASLMAGMSYGRPNAPDIDEDHSNNSADSEKSYNSGETASEKVSYAFDDPLGKAGGLGIELDKLTKFSTEGASAGAYVGDDDDGSHSSDEGEIDSKQSGSGEVPVMDLFAGNFNYEQASDKEVALTPAEEFANFAAFDTTETDNVGVFAGIVDEAIPADQGMHHSSTPRPDLDDIFGKGDHTELLEFDDLAIEGALSPIKPNPPLEVHNIDSASIAENTKQGSIDDATTSKEDVKADLFDTPDRKSEESKMPFDVDIEAAPSDELMADLIEPVSLDTVKEDIGQL